MDFVEWCGVFLDTMLDLQEASPNGADIGIRYPEIEGALAGPGNNRLRSDAVLGAYKEFSSLGVVEEKHNYLRIPRQLRDFARDQRGEWIEVSAINLSHQEAQALRALNRLSERRHEDFAHLEMVPFEDLYAALDLDASYESEQLVEQVLRDLKALGLAKLGGALGPSGQAAQSTYRGLVWEHRRAVTVSSLEIDALVEQGETLTVDLKRELELDTASQKAEFVKDIIALANTKAIGPRYLLVGFTNDGEYYDPEAPEERAKRDRLLAALDAERIQDIASRHTGPVLQIRYDQVPYHGGPIGKLEVLRDSTDLPYRVSESLGSEDRKDRHRRRVTKGQCFIRLGIITRECTPDDIASLEAIAERARRIRS